MKQYECFYRFLVPKKIIAEILVGWLLNLLLLTAVSASESANLVSGSHPVLPPVAVCKNISVQLGPTGTISITGSDVDGGSYDPDGTITNRTVTPNTFNCSQIGANIVLLTVTDDEGLTASCSAIVTVEDKTPPIVICKDYTVYLDAAGKGTITAADVNNGSSDNCSAGLFIYLSRTSFTCADIGSTVDVTLIGTDALGNSSTCTSHITVLDTISPIINVKPLEVVLGSTGSATISPSDLDNGSFDNCGPVTLSVNPGTLTCSDQGQKTVTFTALDSHGNSSSRNVTITVSSTLSIEGMALSSCDLAPSLALFEAEVEGGDNSYSYFWRGLNPGSKPFMVIIPFPPSLQFSNTSILESPFFNNTMPIGYYNIRLRVTDGNGCRDSSDIKINNTGAIFNNQTLRRSEACEGEVRTYSVNYKSDASYSWSVTNGTILTADPDTSRISVRWDLGVISGRIFATISEPNGLFPGGNCQSTVVDTVTISPIPSPAFNNPVTSTCANSIGTYTLTGSYPYNDWLVTGGAVVGGGKVSDNFVTVMWGNGPGGTVTVFAGNNSECTGSIAINVLIYNLSGSVTSISDITCNGGSDGSVTVAGNIGSGVAPFNYSLDGGAFQPSGLFSGISLGNHIITIRDALMCTTDVPFVINQPDPVTGTVATQKDVSCFGGSDGSVTIAAAGGVPPYQYSLNGGGYQPSNIFSGLSAGIFIVTIRDIHLCTGNLTFTISQPAAPLNGTTSVTDVSCFGESTGRIDLTVTGGVAPYSFIWNTGAVTEDLINVPSGNYNVIVTDFNGCTATIAATVGQPLAPITGTTNITNVLCFGNSTGAIDLTAAGGIPPYSFAWSNGATTEDIINLTAGNYSVVITDSNSCTATVTAVITEPATAVNGSIVSQTNVTCPGGSNGAVTVSGSGGTGPYDYQIDAGTFQPSGIFASLTAGIHNVTIRDANLCTFILQVTITEPAISVTGTIVVTDVSCFGGNNGACDLTTTGGIAPYTYLWSNGSVTEDIGNLAAGNYSVTITDAGSCTAVVNAVVNQPSSALSGAVTSQTNVSAYGGNDGSVTVAGSGGTSPYQYCINGGAFQASGTFNLLSAGSYTVTVRDAGLCTFDVSVTITQPWIPLTANLVSQTDILCNGGSNGSVIVTGWGGTSPYEYSIDGGTFQSSGTFSSLNAGIHNVTIRDAVLSTYDFNITISEPAALDVAVSGTDVTCFGASSGSATATVNGGTSPYSYVWNTVPAQTSQVASGLPAGTYTVNVTDANGCLATNSVTILQPAVDMTISITHTNAICAGGTSGSATVAVAGGLAPYTYLWNSDPVQTKETATDLPAGDYTLMVTDSYGCTKTGTVTIGEPLPVMIVSDVNPASCPDNNDGSISLTLSGGTAPYTILWSDGSTALNRTGLLPGTYNVVVTDNNSCAATLEVEVEFTLSSGCLVIPQLITPNNDGFNDEWRIRNIEFYPDAEVRIYNRWGKLVFGSKNLSANPWDGKMDGKLVPTDSYHYILRLNDGSAPRTGVISVIR